MHLIFMEKCNILIGRFQPMTLGHYKCVTEAYNRFRVPTYICLIETKLDRVDSRHPFPSSWLVELYFDIFKNDKKIAGICEVKNADIVKNSEMLRNLGYEPISWTCGSDRFNEYKKMADKYGSKAGLNNDFQVIEIQRSDEDVSATQCREALINGDEKLFNKLIVPVPLSMRIKSEPYKSMKEMIQNMVSEDNNIQNTMDSEPVNEFFFLALSCSALLWFAMNDWTKMNPGDEMRKAWEKMKKTVDDTKKRYEDAKSARTSGASVLSTTKILLGLGQKANEKETDPAKKKDMDEAINKVKECAFDDKGNELSPEEREAKLKKTYPELIEKLNKENKDNKSEIIQGINKTVKEISNTDPEELMKQLPLTGPKSEDEDDNPEAEKFEIKDRDGNPATVRRRSKENGQPGSTNEIRYKDGRVTTISDDELRELKKKFNSNIPNSKPNESLEDWIRNRLNPLKTEFF